MEALLIWVAVLLLVASFIPLLFFQVWVEWRHVDWRPTLAWLKLAWRIRTRKDAITHLDLYFFKLLPTMVGQRIAGQWIELKKLVVSQ